MFWVKYVQIMSKPNNPELISICFSCIYRCRVSFTSCFNTFAFYCLQLAWKFTTSVEQMLWPPESTFLHISLNTDALLSLDFALYFRLFMKMELTDLQLHVRWITYLLYSLTQSKIFECVHSLRQKYGPVCTMIWGMYHTPVNQQHCTERL